MQGVHAKVTLDEDNCAFFNNWNLKKFVHDMQDSGLTTSNEQSHLLDAHLGKALICSPIHASLVSWRCSQSIVTFGTNNAMIPCFHVMITSIDGCMAPRLLTAYLNLNPLSPILLSRWPFKQSCRCRDSTRISPSAQ